ncbi:MAG: hypothetical protein Q7U25_06190 [Sulfuricella sp.]|jgi:chaperonin GroEL|nr:hypothetical protein [Sulfuricella sp.]
MSTSTILAANAINTTNDQYGDRGKGVLDPYQCDPLRAASVAGLMLTTECMVAEMPKEDSAGGGMGGMM